MAGQNEILDVGRQGERVGDQRGGRPDKVWYETWISERGLRVDTCSSRLGTALLEGLYRRKRTLIYTRFQPKSREKERFASNRFRMGTTRSGKARALKPSDLFQGQVVRW